VRKSQLVTSAYSLTIAKVEIHRSFIKDDVATMEKQDSVSIQPGETVKFTHGDFHLMLMELTQPLTPGQTIDIILTTNVGDMLIEMPVKKMQTMAADMAADKQEHADASEHAVSNDSMSSDDKIEHSHSEPMESKEQMSSN